MEARLIGGVTGAAGGTATTSRRTGDMFGAERRTGVRFGFGEVWTTVTGGMTSGLS